jgi:hypothetical protein
MNKITRLLETNKNTKTEDVDDFFLLTIKLKNVFDKFYKSWTRISFKTEEGIQKYQDKNKEIVIAYSNNSENINDAIAKYSSEDNKTGLFESVTKLVKEVKDDVSKILDEEKELPPAKIDNLLDEVGKKITDILKELENQEQINNFGFQLVMYGYVPFYI